MNEKKYKDKIKALEFEIQKYKTAIKEAKLDFFDVNFDTGTATQSDHIIKKMGYTKDELNTFEKRNAIFHPADLKDNLEAIARIKSDNLKKTDLLSRIYTKDDDEFWVKHDGSIIVNPTNNQRHFIGIIRDVTVDKGHLDYLDYLASYDSLTDTFNRRSGLNKLKADFEESKNITIVYIDFNDFKAINDNFGHEAGDVILQKFSKMMKSVIENSGYLVRLGGDEFLIIAYDRTEEETLKMMRRANNLPITYGHNHEFELSYSYGMMAYKPSQHITVESFIHEADQKMYLEKFHSKRNR